MKVNGKIVSGGYNNQGQMVLTIVLGKTDESIPLGLDVQIQDVEKEQRFSALEVVQAIQRLNNEAMRAVDQQMLFWLGRTGKKVETLLPLATHFVAEMMHPLFDKIDTVYFTAMARNLKVILQGS